MTDIASFVLRIRAVCPVDDAVSYHVYQVSENTLITVDSILSKPAYAELTKHERHAIHQGDTRYIRSYIEISNWIPGNSTINTVFFFKDRASQLTVFEDEGQLFDELEIHDFVSHYHTRNNEPPQVGLIYAFPDTYDCVFENARSSDYVLKSKGRACLIEAEQDLFQWKTVFLTGDDSEKNVEAAAVGASEFGISEARATTIAIASEFSDKRVCIENTEDQVIDIGYDA